MQEMRREDTFWNKSKKQLVSQLEISLKDGIESHRAKSWLEEHGLNSLKYSHKRHVLIELILKFKNPIVILLIISAGLAWFVHDTQSASLIFAMIVLSVGMDFTQEHRAHKTAESLQQRVAHHVEVMRDGHKRQIPVTHLVPGDIVMLSAGQLVPADGVVLESTSFFIDQSVVTGENYPVEKRTIDSIENVTSFSMGEALHAVFMGSSVVSGYGKILITKTGIETQLGIISGHLEQADPPSEFSLSLNRFSLFIFKLTIFLVFFSLIINLSFHRDWLESVLFALALAVGLTPEFLPIQVSIAFAHAAKRMATRKVIVKRLSSIHDLGNMNVLCTDKTGTLTEARIKVSSHIDMNGTIFDEVLDWAYLNSLHQEGVLNPLDQAILKCNQSQKSEWIKVGESPFNSSSRRSIVVLKQGDSYLAIAKGAPESLLRICSSVKVQGEKEKFLNEEMQKKIQILFERLSDQGNRVLAVAKCRLESLKDLNLDQPQGLTFCGFITFMDPPKLSSEKTLQELREAGVEIKILSGDNEKVTQFLCESIHQPISGTFTGEQLSKMQPNALEKAVLEGTIFSRVSPNQKLEIIRILKRHGKVVGFVGDGINDAPALHEAHVGISVDSATDVARAAADFILLEQDLSVIQQAVIEGRRTFENLMKYIMMMTSSNLGNMISMACATLFLPFIPMLSVQILLNNFLYDLSQIAIPWDQVDSENLKTAKRWDMKYIRMFMILFGALSSVFDLITFYVLRGLLDATKAEFQTAWFVESLATQILIIFVIRTRRNFFKSRPHPALIALAFTLVSLGFMIALTPLGSYFSFEQLSVKFIFSMIAIILAYLITTESVKGKFFNYFSKV